MALIEQREFLRWLAAYAFVAFSAFGIVQRVSQPESALAIAAHFFGAFFVILTAGMPLIAVCYSALSQSFRARRFGWFFGILFTAFLGAYAYAFWVHEPEGESV